MSWKYFLCDACLYNLPTGENQYGRGGPRPNGPRVPEPLGFGGGCGSTGGAPQCVPHSVRCELSCWSKNCYLGGQSVSKPQTGQQIFLCIHFILLVCVYCFYCMSTKHFCIENSQLCHSTVIALEYPLCSKQINIIASRMVQMLWSAAEHKLSPRHAWHWRSETRGRTDVKTNSVFSLVRVREKNMADCWHTCVPVAWLPALVHSKLIWLLLPRLQLFPAVWPIISMWGSEGFRNGRPPKWRPLFLFIVIIFA